jgi:hypoxanthine phosphoribosyltransferase
MRAGRQRLLPQTLTNPNIMNDTTKPEVLISEAEIAERVQKLAEAIAPRIDNDTVVICLLTGGCGSPQT